MSSSLLIFIIANPNASDLEGGHWKIWLYLIKWFPPLYAWQPRVDEALTRLPVGLTGSLTSYCCC